MLQDRGFPAGRLALLETEEYAGLLQEFAGEIQITQVISPTAFEDIDIAFFTCSTDIMESYIASGARFPELTIDLTQTSRTGSVYLQGISDPRSLRSRGYFVNPHPAAIVLSRVLSSLDRVFGLQSAAVTMMEPASQRGNAGVDELQEQTVSLLNFQHIENKIFEGQLAFNILQEQDASERTEVRVMEQIQAILGDTFPKPMITAVQAPVFHSYAFSVFVHLLNSPTVEELRARVAPGSGPVALERKYRQSPISVVGTDTIHVGRIHRYDNRPGAYALWIVADNLRLAVSNAIQTAEQIMFAPAFEM